MIPATRPDEDEERQEGEPPRPGEPDVRQALSRTRVWGRRTSRSSRKGEAEGGPGGGFDINRLECEREDVCVQPRFLGDSALLYSHEAEGSTSSRRMMVFQGSVSGHQAVVLLDLGANANFVSKEYVRRTGLLERQMATAMEVTTATGRTYSATSHIMSAEVRVVGKHHRSSLVVAPLSTYDVILGTPWFRATKPHFDWEQWTCNGRAVYSKGGRSVGRPGRAARRLQSMVIGSAHQSVMRELAAKYSDVFASKLPPRVVRKDAITRLLRHAGWGDSHPGW